MHPDVLHLDALGLQLLHHDVGIPWALEVEGVVWHARPGTALGVEDAEAGAASPEPYHVGARHLMTRGLLRAQHLAIEAGRGLEVLGIDVPRTQTVHFVWHRSPPRTPRCDLAVSRPRSGAGHRVDLGGAFRQVALDPALAAVLAGEHFADGGRAVHAPGLSRVEGDREHRGLGLDAHVDF